ncbi:succinylglutamate desuccinylase/aspartoacylase family protein [Paenibacillus ottowii]|nr:succinylglutamate desuccinylase/aspartoacylase family protein [Paenibacillus ottowii]MDP1511885.1 succinylglutamate desuccinylase/aspartoacylase family protein [Paenibacillus ottowii]
MKIKKQILALDTKYQTPYYIIKGDYLGETVFVTAGIHGNEIASIRAAKQLLDNLKKGKIVIENGTLILVPIVNQRAYKKRVRGIPDLNRTFPKKSHDSPKHQLSKELFALAQKKNPNWYIDLHEANGLSRINPKRLGQTLITNSDNMARSAVIRIIEKMNSNIPQVQRQFTARFKHKKGSGRTAASRILHAKAITVETCWSLPLSKRIQYQTQIIHYILKEAHLINCLA